MLNLKDNNVEDNLKLYELIKPYYFIFFQELNLKYPAFELDILEISKKVYSSSFSNNDKEKLLEKLEYCKLHYEMIDNLYLDKFNNNSLSYLKKQFFNKIDKIATGINFNESNELILCKFNIEAKKYNLEQIIHKYENNLDKINQLIEIYNLSLEEFYESYNKIKSYGGPISAHTAQVINNIGLSSTGFSFS